LRTRTRSSAGWHRKPKRSRRTLPEIAPGAPSFDPEQLNAMSLDLDAVRQSVDRIATNMSAIQEQMSRGADRIANSIVANQEQIARSVDQLTAGQEQMTREIRKLQAVEQYVLYKNAEPPPRSAPARNQVLRSSQAR
jgi:methyl-accepting chemotaxis protein